VASEATQRLLDQAGEGNGSARHELLERYRSQIRRLVVSWLDPRIARRVDASDIVQETLAEAAEGMDGFLQTRPITFLGWLQRLARSRVIDAHRYHFRQRRSVNREQSILEFANDDSAPRLTSPLISPRNTPSGVMGDKERFDKVIAVLDTLPSRDREILVMWYVEQRSLLEMTEALGLTAHAVRKRHLRAVVKLRECLKSNS
jgi:RNA polymerase sigma-70 factor, ECF subfamily